MNYLGLGYVGRAGARLVSSCKDLYNDLNGANLTGAVDVIGIKQPDGSIKATPFHVRFGKFGVFRTGDLKKEVRQCSKCWVVCTVHITTAVSIRILCLHTKLLLLIMVTFCN